MASVGYARVSTKDQTVRMQVDALTAAGIDRVVEEVASGGKRDRPQLAGLLKYIGEGDVLVVYKTDRLARSLRHLLEIAETLEKRGAHLRSLTEPIDTTSPMGRFTFSLLGALGQLERELIQERTKAGVAAARRKGKVGGRKKAMGPAAVARAMDLARDNPGWTMRQVADSLGVGLSTLYRYCPGLRTRADGEEAA